MKQFLLIGILALLSACSTPPSTELAPISYGTADAPVHITLYHDYQCAACHDFFENIFPILLSQYGANNEVYIEFYDLPIINQDSRAFAALALCTHQHGIVDPQELQRTLFAMNTIYNPQIVETWLTQHTEDPASVLACMDHGDTQQHLTTLRTQAANQGITQTPTVRINQQQHTGRLPFSTYERMIEWELNLQVQ